ncbi:MAG: FecR family protein [Ignavibacteria bacterium]|nr:FecR family protein [Ignavibacteria bacterium]
MNKRSFVLVVIVAVAALLAAPAWNFQQDKRDISAHIIKVVRDVERKSTTGWSKAVTTDQLKSGQEVRTGEKSFAMILFADQSKVAVREKSIITITGQMQGRQIVDRDVYIEKGRVSFGVKKQQTEQFRFTSPISVASIRGTEGGTGFDPAAGEADITIIVGSAEFRNTRSNRSMTVGAGETGKADTSGNVGKDRANQKDLDNNDPNSNVNQGDGRGGAGGGTGGTGGGTDSTATPRDTTGTGGGQPAAARFTLSLPSVTLESGRAVRFQVSLVNKPTEITQGALRYRIQGDPTFKQANLNISADNATVDVPAGDVRAGATKTFEYYITMLGADGKSYTFPEDSPESNPYTLPVKPRTVEILVPVNDPGGTLKYIKISYIE